MTDHHIPMIKLSSQRPMLVIGLGFLLIVLVLGSLVFFGLTRLQAMHDTVDDLITQHNTKIELVQAMRYVARERMIDMHRLVIEDDPFKREEIITHFHDLAAQFFSARNQLESMGLTPEEKRLVDDLRKFASQVSPYQVEVLELLGGGESEQAKQVLREKSMPAQTKVVEQTDRILAYYRHIADEKGKDTHRIHEKTTFAMIMLSGFAASVSFVTALAVLGRVKTDREALQRAQEGLEKQVSERTAELRQSVVRLAEAQQVSRMGHWEWNLEYDRMEWSDEVYRILGRSPQASAVSFDLMEEATYPADREKLIEAIDRVLLDKVPFDFDHRIVRPDGTECYVHQQAHVDFDENGKLLRILGTIQDVTERKRAESKLRLAASVFDNSGEAIMITDAENNIVDINEAFTKITGFERNEVLGQNPRMFKSGKHDVSFYRDLWNALLNRGQWHGEMWAKMKSGDVFPKWQTINAIRDENGIVTNHIAIFRNIAEAKENEAKLWHLAHYDNLCGVANRSLMYTNLHQAIIKARRENHIVAMMLFDLDYFKEVNDSLGHDAGDQLLAHVAQQLKNSVRECDTVARLGGDEFAVILEDVGNKDDVAGVVRKIQRALSQPLILRDGNEITVSASIGISLFPGDGTDIETLIKNADRAMYHAKELGRNNCQFFAEDISKETKPCSPVT